MTRLEVQARPAPARTPASRTTLVAIASAAVATTCGGPGAELPGPSSPAHREAVSAFYVGLAAAQVGLDREAEARWLEVVDRAPGEPAAWADLAILAARRNEGALAAERYATALRLAPEEPRILYAAGRIEIARGEWDRAVGHLERVVELDPGHGPALWALAELAERERGGDLGAAARWLDRLLAGRPDDLAARVERARVAARAGDDEALGRGLRDLRREADTWPPEARDRLAEAEEAARKAGPATAAPNITMLKNVLLRTPEYRESLRALRPGEGAAGGPLIDRPLRLAVPPVGPAPPDTTLAFRAEPWPGAGPGALIVPVHLDPEGPPAIVVLGGTEVRLPGGATVPLPAPLDGAGAPATAWALAAVDLDHDLHVDLVLAGEGGLAIARQVSPGSFADVTARTGLSPEIVRARYTGVHAADLDLDGDLDLVLGVADRSPVVLLNGFGGGFSPAPLLQRAVGVRDLVWADLDGDGDADAALLGVGGRARIYRNRGAGRLDEAAPPETGAPAVAIAVAELDGDDRLDLLALGADGAVRRLSPGGPPSAPVVRWDGVERTDADARLLVADLDNNGCVDLVASAGRSARVWLCGADRAPAARVLEVAGSVSAVADLDGDGRLDLVGRGPDGRPTRFLNRGGAGYRWLDLRLRAAERAGDQRVAPYGLGGEVEVRAGLLYQKHPVEGPVVHVGLGDRSRPDVVRIVWPNGLIQAEFDVEAREIVAIRQRLVGSCPWLFASDGERMAFVTDVLWRSPLGLPAGDGGTKPIVETEDRVLVRGDRLAPVDGAYDLRITSELWETFYVDHVSLVVVDHPAGTAVHVDERFALPPPDLAPRATGPARAIARARDRRGRDVTALVRSRDGRHLAVPGPERVQGVAVDHWVEIDLGPDARGLGGLVLLASGWVRPMDGAAAVAIAQGRDAPPRSLALEVPDGRGGWRTARPDLGFPAGKAKTIVVDLDGVLPEGAPPRLRLRTDLAVFWDAIEWAEARPDAPVRERRLGSSSARLRFRGFSATSTDGPTAPEVPRYDAIEGTAPRWRDLAGYYTRYGDVGELLERVDDRYVIMNAGDELVLRFPAPPPPRPGWVRDFVLVTDGWGKNGEYGTAFAGTVLPLPSHDRPEYDEPVGRLEDDPVYRGHPGDWRRFHTRYVTADRFRRALVVE